MNGINRHGILERVLKRTGLTESTKEIDGGESEMLEVIEVGLYAMFEALSLICCLHYLYGEKVHFEKITVGYVLIEMVMMEAIYIFQLGSTFSLLILPILMLYSGIKFGFKINKLVINNILNIIIVSVLQAMVIILFNTVFKGKKMYEFDLLIINFSIFLTIVCGLKRCKLNKLAELLQSNDMLMKSSVSVVILSTILLLLICKKNKGINILYYGTLGVGVVLLIITVIDIGKHKIRAKEAEAELRLHLLYEASFRELIDEICARQHEFDNHINTIYSQHRLYKTYDELVEAQKKYCGEITEENRYNKILSKGNPVILCFLYSQLSEMEKKGVDVTYQISIGNLECGMPVHKMVELLGNLIKNAMEAVQKSDKRKVHIMMLEETEKIQIEVLNESEPIEEKKIKDFFRKGYSEKGKKRGYGLYNVMKICEEYDAAVICKNERREENNWLMFKIVISRPL